MDLRSLRGQKLRALVHVCMGSYATPCGISHFPIRSGPLEPFVIIDFFCIYPLPQHIVIMNDTSSLTQTTFIITNSTPSLSAVPRKMIDPTDRKPPTDCYGKCRSHIEPAALIPFPSPYEFTGGGGSVNGSGFQKGR